MSLPPHVVEAYALLELDPGAGHDSIRRRYKKLLQQFDPASAIVYGLYTADEARALVADIEQAYHTLTRPDAHTAPSGHLFPEGHPSLRRATERTIAAPRITPRRVQNPLTLIHHPDDAPIRGGVLQRVRSALGVRLEDIADQTKIGMFALRCIEADQYGDLPAKVYLKGFLRQIAQQLDLDPDRVTRDYLAGYEAWEAESTRKRRW